MTGSRRSNVRKPLTELHFLDHLQRRTMVIVVQTALVPRRTTTEICHLITELLQNQHSGQSDYARLAGFSLRSLAHIARNERHHRRRILINVEPY